MSMSIRSNRTQELKGRYDRALRTGLVASLVFHLALFLIFRGAPLPASPFAAAGPRTGDHRAAAGGGMQAMQLQLPPPEIPRPPEPLLVEDLALNEPVPEEPEPEVPEVEPISLEELEGIAGHDPGPDIGPGLRSGTGTGDGGTAEEGRLRVVPPSPRGMLMPPMDRPDRVRGREVRIWVFVRADGRVAADSVRIQPSTGDRGYDRRLRETAARWLFQPATKNGQPVGEWFVYEAIL